MTPRNPYRHSHTVWWAQLLFMFAFAAVLIAFLGLAFALLLSLAPYIRSLP